MEIKTFVAVFRENETSELLEKIGKDFPSSHVMIICENDNKKDGVISP